MSVWIVGISHKTCPIHLREHLFLRPAERELLLSRLQNDPSVLEAMVLSTCNRTEIYVHLLDDRLEGVLENLFRVKKLQASGEWDSYFYRYRGDAAVAHLFSVTAGLQSLIIGEKQILGQVKEAVALARRQGMIGKLFNVMTNLAIRCGKKAQHETAISVGGSSVSWAAVSRASRILGDLSVRSALVLGSGKMGKLAANQLAGRGFGKIYFMNRTLERAQELAARFGGEAVPFWDIAEKLSQVDVCLCSVGAPHYVVDTPLIQRVVARRAGRPLLLMDISIPRNIDPATADIPGVTLLSIDDLDQVVAENVQRRQEAVAQVEKIVRDKVLELERKMQAMARYGDDSVATLSLSGDRGERYVAG